MKSMPGKRPLARRLTRRDFLWLAGVGGASLCLPFFGGCASDPGASERAHSDLPSEPRDITLDREQAPHQISADYGAIQQGEINAYINDLGQNLATYCARPHLPYSFQVVNATNWNAYSFPGGSVALSRGILVEIDNEAELAALIGHEIGHVNAHHAAQKTRPGLLPPSALERFGEALARIDNDEYAPLANNLCGIGGGALLARYKPAEEDEADALGMQYMTRAGQNPEGAVQLLKRLRRASIDRKATVELMAATHPITQGRITSARQLIASDYAKLGVRSLQRERYMDNIAELRRMKPAIMEMQRGQAQQQVAQYQAAKQHFERALRFEPDDYAALLMMSKCQIGLRQARRARYFAKLARQVSPNESQSYYMLGVSRLMQKNYDAAYQDFDEYEQRLAGNPNIIFLQALALDGGGNKKASARQYYRYLQSVDQGGQSEQAYQRLRSWGYLR